MELNETYESAGAIFDISCNTFWPVPGYLQIIYALDFPTCMDECIQWNTKMTEKCVGVGWVQGLNGPLSLSGESECWFFWEMILGDGAESGFGDSGRLQGATLDLPTVIYPEKYLNSF